MPYQLVNVYTFNDSVEANLARNYLEASGVQAFLANDKIVDMIWTWGNAIGWIKLQVEGDDAETARMILDQLEGSDSWTDVDPETVSIEGGEPIQAPAPEDTISDEPEPTPSARDTHAERAFRGAVLGVLFVPLQLYVFYLLLKIFVSQDSLHERERAKATIAAAINLPLVLNLCLQMRFMLSSS